MSTEKRLSTSSSPTRVGKPAVLLPAERIAERVAELADEIRRDLTGTDLTIVIVLKGAFVFAADLIRTLQLPVRVEFIRTESYGDSAHTSGQVRILHEPASLEGRDVLIVEDIVDTGLTLRRVKERMSELGARSVHICTLLDKPPRRQTDLKIDYTGFTIPDVFVTGYGIDYAESGRELPDVCIAETEEEEDDA